MTTNEWIVKHSAKVKRAAEAATKLGAIETHRVMANRIFIEGKNANGQKMGRYNSTTPIYVNPKDSPRKFAPAGKPGNKVKKQQRKSKWFASYRAYRSFLGKQTDPVNLNLFGLLQSDFVSGLSGRGTEYVSVLKNPFNQKKKRGLEKRFGAKIFSASEKEKELFRKLNQEEFNRIMKSA